MPQIGKLLVIKVKMSNPLNNLKLDHWSKIMIVIGFPCLVLSLTVKLINIDNNVVQLLSASLLLFGLGELINHPIHTVLLQTETEF